MRLIDADELIDKAWEERHKDDFNIFQIIADMPTVDTEKHGHWIENFKSLECPFCNSVYHIRMNYCGNCGAKMDEAERKQIEADYRLQEAEY